MPITIQFSCLLIVWEIKYENPLEICRFEMYPRQKKQIGNWRKPCVSQQVLYKYM